MKLPFGQNRSGVRVLFERELTARGLSWSYEAEEDLYAVSCSRWQLKISLENLQREYSLSGDPSCVSDFLENALLAVQFPAEVTRHSIYWALQSGEVVPAPEYAVEVSPMVNRILVHYPGGAAGCSWLTEKQLHEAGISSGDAFEMGFENLSRALSECKVQTMETAAGRIVFLESDLPFHASLILAPNLKTVLAEHLGWPLMAVAPDSSFVLFWAEADRGVAGLIGATTVKQFMEAPHPLSPEVYSLTDTGLQAVGIFPVQG
jgi:hypothetical protein